MSATINLRGPSVDPTLPIIYPVDINNAVNAALLANYNAIGGRVNIYLGNLGVKCDGVTDDGPAFNAAIAYVKANYSFGGIPAANLIWPSGTAMIRTTMDFTGFQGVPQIFVTAYGTAFLGNTTGMPIVDMTGTQDCRWLGGRFFGDDVNTPKCAFRIGRPGPAPLQGSRNILEYILCHGSFTRTCVYLNGAEGTIMLGCRFANTYPNSAQLAANPTAGDTHGLTLDGFSKYWSDIPTVCVGAVTPGLTSFLGPTCICCASSAGGINPANHSTAYWIGSAQGASFTNGCYGVVINSVGGPVVTLWQEAGGTLHNLDLGDMHKEMPSAGSNVWPMLLFTGSGVSSVLHKGLIYRDPQEGGTATYIFGRGGSVTNVQLQNITISISNDNQATQFFDDGTAFSLTGAVYLGGSGPSSVPWNLADGRFHGGTLNIDGTVTTYGITSPDGLTTGTDLLSGQLAINGPSTTGRQIRWNAASVLQWVFGMTTSGANDFSLSRFDDSGNPLGSVIFVTRATGLVTILGALQSNGGLAAFGVAPPVTRPTVTGSRGGNAALASLLTALAATGLIIDGSSA